MFFLPPLCEHLPLYCTEALLFLLPIFLSVLGERNILTLKKLKKIPLCHPQEGSSIARRDTAPLKKPYHRVLLDLF
jgi:hypothetical protein